MATQIENPGQQHKGSLHKEVVSAVAVGNLQTISSQPAMLSNLAFANAVATNNLGQQNAVNNQLTVNQLGVSTLASASNTVSNLGPMQARSAVDVLSNNELAQAMADLKSVVEAFASGKAPQRWQPPGPIFKLLEEWLKLGLRFDGGVLVVPASLSVRFAGEFGEEDIEIDVGKDGVTVSVVVQAS